MSGLPKWQVSSDHPDAIPVHVYWPTAPDGSVETICGGQWADPAGLEDAEDDALKCGGCLDYLPLLQLEDDILSSRPGHRRWLVAAVAAVLAVAGGVVCFLWVPLAQMPFVFAFGYLYLPWALLHL